MTGLEVAEERERDASRQGRRDEWAATALAAADTALEAQEEERREEHDLAATAWVADTQLQLQLSQLLYLNANGRGDQQEKSSSSLSNALSDALTMRMMMLGLAANPAARLSLLRSHPLMRATVSLTDLAASGGRPELLNHSCRRLRRVSYLLQVPGQKSEL